jgi:ubiquinone/menaquinone biosynthesis C-methylase UbiE
MALHHIIDIETALRSLYKLLKNEGYLCIIELVEDDGSFHKSDKEFKGHNGFNTDKLKEILEKIGFTHVTANTFYNDHKIVEDSKIDYSLFIMVGRK